MDLIQKTVELFTSLIERMKTIGALLTSAYLPHDEISRSEKKVFWIFNW